MFKKITYLYHNNRKQFTIYVVVGVFMTVLSIFLMWLLIDVFKINTILSGIIITGGLFILKFIIYKKTGFID